MLPEESLPIIGERDLDLSEARFKSSFDVIFEAEMRLLVLISEPLLTFLSGEQSLELTC